MFLICIWFMCVCGGGVCVWGGGGAGCCSIFKSKNAFAITQLYILLISDVCVELLLDLYACALYNTGL